MHSRICDCHTHIFPDQIAARTIRALEEAGSVRASFDGTRRGLLEQMKAAGITASINCPIATKPEQTESINSWAALQTWPLISLGSIHPGHPDPEKEIKRIRDLGLKGIKMHPEYQTERIDSKGMCTIWRLCEKHNIPVLLHAGEDIGFSPPFRSDPRMISAMIDAFPHLVLVAAHFGSYRMWDEVNHFLIGKKIYLDISYTLHELDNRLFLDMARRHGMELIMFGSDTPWKPPDSDIERLDRLELTEGEKRTLFWESADSVFNFNSTA